MFNQQLTQAVENFASLMLSFSEKELGRSWKWKDHDTEGIRFAFFVTLQELRQLAVALSTHHSRPTPAQHILGQYHAAYLDLQAALLGISQEDAIRTPAEGEWSVQRTYNHILGADFAFTLLIRYALEGHRAGSWKPERPLEADQAKLAGMTEAEYQTLMMSPLEVMRTFHRKFHAEIIQEFSRITHAELDLPSVFWEETHFPIRHRLHRYEAHIAQHTVQIDKILAAIGQAPGESKRLIRMIYAALAEADGFMMGKGKMDDAAILETASSISERTGEIANLPDVN